MSAEDKAVHPDTWHLPNFVDCIRSRQDPNETVKQGHLSACLEHLGNIACRTGNQRLVPDPRTGTFPDSPETIGYLKPAYRPPYRVEAL